jgi:hypothetical protein
MTLAQHDYHRRQLRVLSSRHGRPLPIARSNGPADPSIALLDPSFASPTRDRALRGPSRRLSPAADQPIGTTATNSMTAGAAPAPLAARVQSNAVCAAATRHTNR